MQVEVGGYLEPIACHAPNGIDCSTKDAIVRVCIQRATAIGDGRTIWCLMSSQNCAAKNKRAAYVAPRV